MTLNHVPTVSLLANSQKCHGDTGKFYSPKMRVNHSRFVIPVMELAAADLFLLVWEIGLHDLSWEW